MNNQKFVALENAHNFSDISFIRPSQIIWLMSPIIFVSLLLKSQYNADLSHDRIYRPLNQRYSYSLREGGQMHNVSRLSSPIQETVYESRVDNALLLEFDNNTIAKGEREQLVT